MSLTDIHELGIGVILNLHGVTIKVTRDDVEYQFQALFNCVEYGIRLGDLEKMLGEKTNIYTTRLELTNQELNNLNDGEIITATPNSYDDEKEYKISIPKLDYQLPGALYFLEEINNESTNWSTGRV